MNRTDIIFASGKPALVGGIIVSLRNPHDLGIVLYLVSIHNELVAACQYAEVTEASVEDVIQKRSNRLQRINSSRCLQNGSNSLKLPSPSLKPDALVCQFSTNWTFQMRGHP
eukprot:Platyproteum_vivax@DN3138_c0_g1_i1.p1